MASANCVAFPLLSLPLNCCAPKMTVSVPFTLFNLSSTLSSCFHLLKTLRIKVEEVGLDSSSALNTQHNHSSSLVLKSGAICNFNSFSNSLSNMVMLFIQVSNYVANKREKAVFIAFHHLIFPPSQKPPKALYTRIINKTITGKPYQDLLRRADQVILIGDPSCV